jgi:hypothetical protein
MAETYGRFLRSYNAPDCDAICPITLEKINGEIHEFVTIISNSVDLSDKDREKLIESGYTLPEKTGTCHYVVTYNIEAAYIWFVLRKMADPISRRYLDNSELNRIEFRYSMSNYLKQQPSTQDLKNMFDHYIYNFIHRNDQIGNELALLRCHMVPSMFPNFMNISRQQAKEILLKAKMKYPEQSPSWIIRPSEYKGTEFVRDNDGTLIPMSEYIVISYFSRISNNVEHILIEKIYSKGYFRSSGDYHGHTLEILRGEGFVCLFDIVHSILLKIKDEINIGMYDTS